MDESHKVTITDREMFLVLDALEMKLAWVSPEKSAEYKTLHDRLERIYEGRDQ